MDSTVEATGAAAGLPLDVNAKTMERVLGSLDETEAEGVLVGDWVRWAVEGDDQLRSLLAPE